MKIVILLFLNGNFQFDLFSRFALSVYAQFYCRFLHSLAHAQLKATVSRISADRNAKHVTASCCTADK